MSTPKTEYWDSYYNGKSIDNIDKCDDWLEKYANLFNRHCPVLDLGCGYGTNIDTLLQKCEKVYAADFSKPALELIEQKYKGQQVFTQCFDMRDTFPFPNDFFGTVVADLSIHYFRTEDTKNILNEIKRILMPNGFLLARVHSITNLPETHIETEESGLVIANGFQRKYFTVNEIELLLEDWHIHFLKECTIHRFSKDKNIIEFAAKPFEIT